MTTAQLSSIAPLAAPLPPVPDGEVFTKDQWTTFYAIADTIVPTISDSAPPSSLTELSTPESTLSTISNTIASNYCNDPPLVQSYLHENASSIPEFKDLIHRLFTFHVRPEAAKGLGFILSALNSTAGCLLLTQSTTPFHRQSLQVRTQILRNWANSYLPPLREAQKSFQGLCSKVWISTSPTYARIVGIPRAPAHVKPGEGFGFNFLQFMPSDSPETLETDVVIVGSGCGGAVCAANLAQAGHRVIVVEKAYHFPPTHFPMTEAHAGAHLYMNGGLEVPDDNSITILAGSCWGGGGTVNWSASLQTQAVVRQEWADQGLPFFTSAEYQKCLDRVCDRMGVSAQHIEHNFGNKALLEGARKLGYAHKVVPQNTGGHKHNDGFCSLGCGAAEKQGPAVSFLPDASKAGATFIEGMHVERVMLEKTENGKERAVGVEGTWTRRDGNKGVVGVESTKRKVVIRAKRVIVAAGTLQSPLLLLRSGVKNGMVGRNLHLHPATLVAATYESPVLPWEGPILTSLVDEFSSEDGLGHGTKVECTVMMPSMFLPVFPWHGGLEFKELISKFRNMAGFVIINRDRDTGRVFADEKDGRCRIQYTPSQWDRDRTINGILGAAKIAYVTGATEILTATRGVPAFIRSSPPSTSSPPSLDEPGINDSPFAAWLDIIRAKGLPLPETTFASAHQMGTCRMGTSPKTSVVDPEGRVWGTEGLYVADASVFPSASGVNPMVTNMGISDWISRKIAKGLSG